MLPLTAKELVCEELRFYKLLQTFIRSAQGGRPCRLSFRSLQSQEGQMAPWSPACCRLHPTNALCCVLAEQSKVAVSRIELCGLLQLCAQAAQTSQQMPLAAWHVRL